MGGKGFSAVVLRKTNGVQQCGMEELETESLPEGDVLIKVAYSSVNYKDALAVTGKGAIVKSFPMVPGIDLAGVIEQSASPDYRVGEKVIVTGWGVGERHWGGYSEYARVHPSWITRLPPGLTLKQAMAAGTAGLTGMLCVMALEQIGVAVGSSIAVTGASGGVGSFSVGLLSRLGYQVTASTGRMAEYEDFLKELGAVEVIDRSVLSNLGKPLESQLWSGAVDTAGGTTLAGLLSRIRYGGAVAACGLAGGHELHTTVFPFILRSVKLIGVDSVMCPAEVRETAWDRISEQIPLLDRIAKSAPFTDVIQVCDDLLQGKISGRVIIAIDESL